MSIRADRPHNISIILSNLSYLNCLFPPKQLYSSVALNTTNNIQNFINPQVENVENATERKKL